MIPEDAAVIRDRVMDILQRAMAGYTTDYKIQMDGHWYTQWGKVEQDIRALFDAPDPKAAIIAENRAMRDALESIEAIVTENMELTPNTRLIVRRTRVRNEGVESEP